MILLNMIGGTYKSKKIGINFLELKLCLCLKMLYVKSMDHVFIQILLIYCRTFKFNNTHIFEVAVQSKQIFIQICLITTKLQNVHS